MLTIPPARVSVGEDRLEGRCGEDGVGPAVEVGDAGGADAVDDGRWGWAEASGEQAEEGFAAALDTAFDTAFDTTFRTTFRTTLRTELVSGGHQACLGIGTDPTHQLRELRRGHVGDLQDVGP